MPFLTRTAQLLSPSLQGVPADSTYGYVPVHQSAVAQTGIYKYERSNPGNYSVFGNSGAGQISEHARGTALSTDGATLYVLDYGNLRIASYDTTTGVFLGDFAMPADTADTALSYRNGRMYTANGNGGGRIYDAPTGIPIGAFQSEVANAARPVVSIIPGTLEGGTAPSDITLVLARGSNIVLMDGTTGVHGFTDTADSVPEPATLALATLALAALALARRRL